MSPTPQTAGEEWKRHWPLVLSGMVGFSFFTVVTYSLGTFIEPLEKAFGWSRTEIALGLTIFGAIQMLGGPPVGALLDRYGTRSMAIFGMIACGASFAAFGLANGSLTQWFALWTVFGLCALMIKSTLWSAATSSVFTTSRGLALAVVLSGSAIGQSFAPLIANALITARGWQQAYLWIGLGWAGLATVLLALFFFDARALARQGVAALKRDDPASPAKPAPVLPGLTARQGFRDSRVLRIAAANLLMATAGSAISIHLVPLVTEAGVSRANAVEIAATAGISGLIGKILTGWLLDRYAGSVIPFLSFAVAAIGHILLLDMLDTTWALMLGVMVLGYTSGAGLQVSTYLISRYAGLKSFGVIFGTISSMMMGGTALGPALSGYIHDVTGSYTLMLSIAAPTMFICALLFVGLGPYPDFNSDKKN